ncbi:hypothetical protein QMK17_07140 [Rhodococcus sp. G-MC3]|uniref:hypothetical protein n=1 Tax=Rhodococcus sp. G-MC3 TaxID=3046209 RepID=UPI0024B9EDE2|nr:hypothetical protein [Rhodococcus sp. G-MC3]MDJ0393104.1 hypothetical protein [Rhodococcus sp. G-MC3]
MRRAATVATVSAAMIMLAGCGSDETAPAASPPRTDPGPAVPAPEPLLGGPIADSAALEAAMLDGGELPDGYSAIPDPVRDLGLDPAPDYDAPDRSRTDPAGCGDVLAAVSQQAAGAVSNAQVRYSGPNFSSIDEDAASYSDAGAAGAFARLQETFAACGQYSGTDADGVAVVYRVGSRDQEQVGDASTSIRLETTSEGFTLISDAVVAVVDRTVVQFVVTSQEGVDPASFTTLATAAADKIRGANTGV